MEILKQFGVQPIYLAAQVVNFLMLLFVLNKLLYHPILKMLKQRQDRITKSLKEAEEIEKRLQQTEIDRDKVLARAATEAKKIIDETTQVSNQIVAEAHTKASAEMAKILEQGRQSIRLEKARMQQEIRAELADLVVLGIEKVAGKALNKKNHKELVERSIKDL